MSSTYCGNSSLLQLNLQLLDISTAKGKHPCMAIVEQAPTTENAQFRKNLRAHEALLQEVWRFSYGNLGVRSSFINDQKITVHITDTLVRPIIESILTSSTCDWEVIGDSPTPLDSQQLPQAPPRPGVPAYLEPFSA